MKIILVIATALWCVSVLTDVNATMIQPMGPVQGNPQEAFPEPLKSVNEPLGGVKRVRRQTLSPVVFDCDGTQYTASWTSAGFEVTDSEGNVLEGVPSSGGTMKCDSDGPGVLTCSYANGAHKFSVFCDGTAIRVQTTDPSVKETFVLGTSPLNPSILTFVGNSWTWTFAFITNGCPLEVEVDSEGFEVTTIDDTTFIVDLAKVFASNKGGNGKSNKGGNGKGNNGNGKGNGGGGVTTLLTQGLAEMMNGGQG